MAAALDARLSAHPGHDRVNVVLATPDPENMVREFIEAHNVSLPVLLDDAYLFGTYERDAIGDTHAPFPLHVVIDGDGVIRHLSVEADPDAIATVIEGLLDEG